MTASPMNRRSFLRASAAAGGVLLVSAATVGEALGSAVPPFAHGVASGDPLPHGVLLWTRVTPTPESVPGSGAGPTVSVGWQVARDAAFADVVAAGTRTTGPGRDHTVKVDVRGLAPSTRYWYRFSLDGVYSGVGRTGTAPARAASLAGLRFGMVSCSNWQAGHFSAYRHLAARDDLDLVVHLGDYLYEYQVGGFGNRGVTVRPHDPAHEIVTLADYRRRHAQYKTDPDVQALHARCPWAVTWDDHETANDAWSDGAGNHQPETEGDWGTRYSAAKRAYFEWMPVRPGAGGTVYRRLHFGRLLDLSLLDLRSYRSQQADGAAAHDPARTIAGDPQLTWLKDGLAASAARWKLVGNPVMIAPVSIEPLPVELIAPVSELLGLSSAVPKLGPDQWNGYTADRRELLEHLVANQITDTVFLTGDIHSSWAIDLPLDRTNYLLAGSVATEFVATSVTSDNLDDILNVPPRTASLVAEGYLKAANPFVKYAELDSHGYCVVDVRPDRLQTDWWYLADKTDPATTARWAASYAVAAGTQRVVRVATPVS